jgi:adenosylcobinamide-GDP ribazoletransferase
MLRSLASAVRFLTVVPAARGADPLPEYTVAWFPVVGALLGAIGAAVFLGLQRFVPVSWAALATVLVWAAIAGVPHEGRFSLFGGIALALAVLARWQALEQVPAPAVLAACVAAQAVSRAAMAGLAWISRPSGLGTGYALASTLNTTAALIAMALGAGAAVLGGPRAGILVILGSYLIDRAIQWIFYRRFGGMNGDGLGIAGQLVEILVLLVFAAGPVP